MTAIDVTPSLDVILGYSSGRVIFIKANGGYPQTTPSNVCGINIRHGKLNFIKYVHEEDMIVAGYDNGVVHILKVQAHRLTAQFLRGCYCSKKNSDLTAIGSFIVINKTAEKQLEIWCGCSDSRIETRNFALADIPIWKQSLVTSTYSEISLRHPNYTPLSAAVSHLIVTPDKESVFTLIEGTTKYGIVAICQINAATKAVLRHWQCDFGKGAYLHVIFPTIHGLVILHLSIIQSACLGWFGSEGSFSLFLSKTILFIV